MDTIREYLKNPLVVGIIGFLVGAIIGLVVLGWWLFPVEWVDASPEQLSFDSKVEYVRMSVEAYGYTNDAVTAKARYASVGEDAEKALAAVVQDPGSLSPEITMAYGEVVTGVAVEPGEPIEQEPGATEEAEQPQRSLLAALLPILCVLFLVIAAIIIVFFLYRSRQGSSAPPTPAMEAQQAARDADFTDYAAVGSEPPIAQFMASYKLGDDLFDDSFSIDSASGEFLGECGVGISETIGVGDPKKVTAFEVWLFDKNDIQTVTKVLMSAHAFNDASVRQGLEAKGEPVLAELGSETVLDTQTLRLVTRVVEMGYGDGASPPEGFFDQLILELAIWQKVEAL